MPQPRISGQYVNAYVESAGEVSAIFERKAREFLEDHGFESVDDGDWYPMDQFADALHTIENDVGSMTSEQAGIKQVAITDSITDMDSLEDAVAGGNEVLQAVYQHYSPAEVGEMRHERLSESRRRLSFYGAWPYPPHFTLGIFKGLLRATSGLELVDTEPADPKRGEACAFVFEV